MAIDRVAGKKFLRLQFQGTGGLVSDFRFIHAAKEIVTLCKLLSVHAEKVCFGFGRQPGVIKDARGPTRITIGMVVGTGARLETARLARRLSIRRAGPAAAAAATAFGMLRFATTVLLLESAVTVLL